MLALALLQPAPVLADNECGLQAGTTPIECPSDDYSPDGITYVSVGDLVLNLEPISAFGTSLGSGGLDISAGAAGDSLTVTTERIAGFRHTAPVVVDLSTQAGDIILDSSTSSVSNPDIQGNAGATQYGVRAISGSGNIDLNLGGVTATGTPGIAAVYAETGGGGSIDIATARTVSGRQYGIQALANGSGALTIAAAGAVDVNSTDGIAAIDATTGTGLLTIDIASGSGTVNGRSGAAIRTDTGGDAVISIAAGRSVQAGSSSSPSSTGALNLTAAGDITVDNAGSISGVGTGVAIQATGNSVVLNNDGSISGAIDFSSLTGTGGYIFNNDGIWGLGDTGSIVPIAATSLLGMGDLNNTGTIAIARRALVSAPGTNFAGTGNSTLEIRADLIGGSQLNCSSPTIAGCVDLTGGTTSGQTAIRIRGQGGGNFNDPIDTQASAGVVLVDVGGGTTSADHFVLDPDSGFFNQSLYAEHPIYGSVLVTGGPFNYTLLYNPEKQQHVLASVPEREAVEYAAFIHESLSIWHTTTDTVTGRNAELRDRVKDGRGWLRVVNEQTDRDAAPVFTSHGNTFVYDQFGKDYSLETRALIGGYDLLATDTHAVGLHVGLVTADAEFGNGSPTEDKIRGATFGAYGGWQRGALTVDGTVNVNVLEIERDQAILEDSSSNVKSLGARVEAGWLQPLMGDALYVQPLVTAAYVITDIEALELRDNQLRFKEEKSARAALGVRLGGETEVDWASIGKFGYWLTARAWDEQEGDGNVQFVTDADPLAIEDDLSGSFEEVNLGVELSNAKGDLSAYLSGGAKFADDQDNYNVSIGARMRW